jgi:hypothetical protein
MLAVWSPDHQAAEIVVSSDIVNDHAAVYVIEMTGGTFTALNGGPAGMPPHGNVLTLTVNAESFETTDVGITNMRTDLRRISSHIVDLLVD